MDPNQVVRSQQAAELVGISKQTLLVVLAERQSGSPHEELMADLMSLIASFSGRFYKLRSIENQRRVLALAADALAGKGES